jgi:hypothetical protein
MVTSMFLDVLVGEGAETQHWKFIGGPETEVWVRDILAAVEGVGAAQFSEGGLCRAA